jgi:hypothetical protein
MPRTRARDPAYVRTGQRETLRYTIAYRRDDGSQAEFTYTAKDAAESIVLREAMGPPMKVIYFTLDGTELRYLHL